MIFTSLTWRRFLVEKQNIWRGFIIRSKKKQNSKTELINKAHRGATAIRIRQLNKKPRAKSVLSPSTDFHNTQWCKLITRSSLLNEGRGPCVTQREGKLFRRELALKCKKFSLFGSRCNDDTDLCNKIFVQEQ